MPQPWRTTLRPPAARGVGKPDDAIKETLQLIRAQSAIRFAALPFFLVALAVLTKTFFEVPNTIDQRLIALAALGLTTVAMVVEIVLSRNLLAWWTAITPLAQAHPPWQVVLAHRNPSALSWARWALLSPYVASLVFWLQRLLCVVLPVPDRTAAGSQPVAFFLVAAVFGAAACLVAAAAWRAAGREPR